MAFFPNNSRFLTIKPNVRCCWEWVVREKIIPQSELDKERGGRELLHVRKKGNRSEECPIPGAVPHACDIHAVLDPTSWWFLYLDICACYWLTFDLIWNIACSVCREIYPLQRHMFPREVPMNASSDTHGRLHFLTVGFRRCRERSSPALEFCRWSSMIIARDRFGYLMPCFISSCKHLCDSCI